MCRRGRNLEKQYYEPYPRMLFLWQLGQVAIKSDWSWGIPLACECLCSQGCFCQGLMFRGFLSGAEKNTHRKNRMFKKTDELVFKSLFRIQKCPFFCAFESNYGWWICVTLRALSVTHRAVAIDWLSRAY